MKISNEVMEVLGRCSVKGNGLFFPETLERKLYQATAKVLKNLGGKWNTKAKSTVFDRCPEELI